MNEKAEKERILAIDELTSSFPLCFGQCDIHVDMGWFGLLYDLGEELEPVIYKHITSLAHKKGKKEILRVPHVTKVGSRFGGMRINLSGIDNDEIDLLLGKVKKYEIYSLNTCESCGNKGSLSKKHPTSKYKVACEKHL